MIRCTSPTALLLISASAAHAVTCPTVDDLVKGIEFVDSEGYSETHRRLRPDWITLQLIEPDGFFSVIELFHGIYTKNSIPFSNGIPQMSEETVYATDAELAGWSKPTPNSNWVNTADGGSVASSGAVKPFTISSCSYDAFEVEITYQDDDNYSETLVYLADLGVSLLVSTKDNAGVTTYSYKSLRAIE